MPIYTVRIPVTGSIVVADVDADSEKEAIEVAIDREFSNTDIEEFETHEKVMDGPICNAVLQEAIAEDNE